MMASGPLKRCSKPGCGALVRGAARCERHTTQHNRATGKNKPGDPFYSARPWRALRRSWLSDNPLCVACLDRGRVTAGTEVDHIEPRAEAPGREYDETNLQTLCKGCHSRKTGRERRAAISANKP